MSKFCTKCGRALEDGEVCTCQQPADTPNAQNPATQQAQIPQPQMQQPVPPMYQQPPAAPAQPSAMEQYFKRFFSLVKLALKSPGSAAKQCAQANDFKLSFAPIAVHALFTAFLFMIIAGKVNGLTKSVGSLSDSLTSSSVGSMVGNMVSFPMFRIFFVVLIVTAGLAFLLPAIQLLFSKVVFKGNPSYTKLLCASGMNSLCIAPFMVVACLLTLILPLGSATVIVPFTLAAWGIAMGQMVCVASIESSAGLSHDKALYSEFFSVVAMSVVLVILLQLLVPFCMPSMLNTLGAGISSLF